MHGYLFIQISYFAMHNEFAIAAYFVAGTDIGRLTIKTIDDIRALNKNVHFRPACNLYNINELASLWEKKIGRTLPRVTISENDLLVAAAENCIPQSIVASFTHDIFIKGCQVNFAIDGPQMLKWEISTLMKLFEAWMSASMTFLSRLTAIYEHQ
ncbi:hypothetical protein SLA2020_474770 [Shorea laevis]